MSDDWLTSARLAALLHAVFVKHGIQRAILFGSFARGEPSRRSDVDLILVQETDERFLDRYAGILSEIVDLVRGHDVDLLIYTPAELERMKDRPMIAQALREGIVLYESEQEPASG